MLIDIIHGDLHQGAPLAFVAHSRLGMGHDANEFGGVASSQAGGLQI